MLWIIAFHFSVRTMVHVMDKIMTRIEWHGMFTEHFCIYAFDGQVSDLLSYSIGQIIRFMCRFIVG